MANKIQVLECVLLSLGFIKIEIRPYQGHFRPGIGQYWPTSGHLDVTVGRVYDVACCCCAAFFNCSGIAVED